MCSQRISQPPVPVPAATTTPPPPQTIPFSFVVALHQTDQDSPCSSLVTKQASQDYLSSREVQDTPHTLSRKEDSLSPSQADRERGRRNRQRLYNGGENKCDLQNGRSPLSSCENGDSGKRGHRQDHFANDIKQSRLTSEKKEASRKRKRSISHESKTQHPNQHTRAVKSRSPCRDIDRICTRSRSNSSHRRETDCSSLSPAGHVSTHDSQCSSLKCSRSNGREQRERSRSPHYLQHRQQSEEGERLPYRRIRRSYGSHEHSKEEQLLSSHSTLKSHRERDDHFRQSDERRETEPTRLRSTRSSLDSHKEYRGPRELRKNEFRLRQHEHELETSRDRHENRHSERLKLSTPKSSERSREYSRTKLPSPRRQSGSCKNGNKLRPQLKLSPASTYSSNSTSPLSPTEQLLVDTTSLPILSEDGLLINHSPNKQLLRENDKQKTDGRNLDTTHGSSRNTGISTETFAPQSNGLLQTTSSEDHENDEFEEGEILSTSSDSI